MRSFLRPDATAVLKDKVARGSLARYFAVMQNDRSAKFLIAKKLPAPFNPESTTEELWKRHDYLLKDYFRLEAALDSRVKIIDELAAPSHSFLDLKIEIAKRILESCHFCSRRCNINRKEGELGYCRCGSRETMVSTIFEHMGEEPELVPSGTIFTMGCTMQCRHCQNWTISQWLDSGESYPPRRLAAAIQHLRQNGCRNVNLVGGDPTPWIAQWLETFNYVTMNVPVVWNSNAYYSEETARLLAGFVDAYLLDFKYGNNVCAQRISDAPNYWEACTHNHLHAKEFGELIIRVLILPDHLDCCANPILEWIGVNLGATTRTNIMFQYRPEWRAHELSELRRRLTHVERDQAIQLAKQAGLCNFIT